jgi:hypothetical protein
MRAASIALGLVVMLVTLQAQLRSSPRSQTPAILYTIAKQYEPLAWMTGHDRFPQGATLFIQDEHGRRPLVREFAASADPSISFDGARVLFAGKQRANDHWQIWEVSLADNRLRQMSRCPAGCVRPLYLPEERVAYAQYKNRNLVIRVGSLPRGTSTPVTYGPGNFLPTDILRDGRILFEAAQPLGAGATAEIYTVYTDGSGVESYRCDHGSLRHSGRQVSSGDIVFAHGRGMARFTSALAHEVELSMPAGEYAGDVAETPNGDWLLASRKNPASPFSISRWEPGSHRLVPVLEREDNVIQPTLLAARPVPNRHPSALHDWSYANLLCLNAYTSKYGFRKGTIAAVRLYARQASGSAKVLGEALVESDGSFYLRIPGDQPLKIELLDASGNSLKKEAGWFWLRRGEQRICVGCHAGPETAPENAVPAVLLRSTVPADMTGTKSAVASGGH